jgi:hypothetical protein
MHTSITPRAHAEDRHTILPKPSDSLTGDPRMLFAGALGMNHAIRSITRPQRVLKLMTTPESERPTNPDNLKPDDPIHSVIIPEPAPLPKSLVERAALLPNPNPDSYIEMGVSLLLHEMQQRELDTPALLERQKRSFEASLETGHRMLKEAIFARVGKTETAVESLRTEVAELRLKIAELEPMKTRLAGLEQRLASWPPGQQQ